ncbi:uroporphyrinogen decarboxylase [Aestuariivirga sp.]|uniref:uroporphyrinogen decarboxylase n=1 Tax=Aestuariivirga sp. TaxID=2650926 RepID=UPI0039E41D37
MIDGKTGKALLDVLKRQAPERRPMWFMRQAGRYLPEYRAVREKAGSFLDLCYTPKLAAEVTLQPLRRFDLDAAILFADILVVPHAMGLGLRFAEGEGPILDVVRDAGGVSALKPCGGSREVKSVCETVRIVRDALPEKVTLIGFCGGPWTVASYMIEGGSSDRVKAKIVAFQRAPWFCALIDRLVDESVSYLCLQIEAGAEAVQVFDSWAGDLPGSVREQFVLEPLTRIAAGVRSRFPEIPIILFGRGLGADHARLAERSGCAAVGIETEVNLAEVADLVGDRCGIQGNLDPVALLAGENAAVVAALEVAAAVPFERHIFNLGHGIRPGTEAEIVGRVVGAVRDFDAGRLS